MSKPTSLVAEEDVLDPGTLVDDFSKCSLCGLNLGPGSSKYHLEKHQKISNCTKARTGAQQKGAQVAFMGFFKVPKATG